MKTDYRLRMVLGGTGLLVLVLTLFCAYRLFGVGTLAWHIVQPETVALYGELLLLFFLLLFALRIQRVWMRVGIFVGILLIFSWVHVVFLPMIMAGLYLCFLCYLGKWLRITVFRVKENEKGNEKENRKESEGEEKRKAKRMRGRIACYADGVFGAVFVILLFCLLSAFQIGGYKKQIAVLALLAFPLAIWVIRGWIAQKDQIRSWGASWTLTWGESVALALITVLFCLQIGRMNLAVDYDSLWYGLRSEYVLDNGKGIYENLGMLGVVYTYSKAQEILLLPFASLPSHSFLLVFSVYATILAVDVFYQTAKLWMSTAYARFATVCIASIPAIMNMSISAKTDAGTLLIQLLMFYFLLYFQKEKQTKDLIWACAMLLFSFTLKPTSIVFSSAVFGMSLLYFMFTRNRIIPKKWKEYAILLPFGVEIVAVFLRTWLITGVPLTSVYTSLFQKLGFSVRYPFEIPEVKAGELVRAQTLSFAQKGERFLKRLYGVFICPEEKIDMAHVIFAWGGLFCLVCLIIGILWLCFRVTGRIQVKKTGIRSFTRGGYLFWILFPITVGSLYILYDLTQIDGNYYNFPYALCVFAGCYGISQAGNRVIQTAWKGLLVPAIVLGIVMSSVTNWDWQIGLTPISIKHKGYYPHEQLEHESMATGEFSSAGIWHILAQNPRNRVISFGEHPDTLLFPCSMQSYGDIAGSWGNPMVVESVEKFRDFVTYAKTDYVYIQANYMCRWEDPYSFLCKLIYDGVLTDFIFENGNALARVDASGEHNSYAEEQLAKFEEIYHPADWPRRLQK